MYSKLLEFQKRVTPIAKDSQNPFFHSRYFDINSLLAEIRPILNELGLVILQPLSYVGEKPAIKTMLIDVESGKVLVGDETPIPENTDPQKMGAAITYFRRYALQSLLCLEAEDDDAESAVRPKPVNQGYKEELARQAQPAAPAAQPWKKWEKPAGRPQKIEGDKCPDCGGTYIKSKTGTIFCNNKCWLPENAHLKGMKDAFPQMTVIQQDEIDVSGVPFD